MAQTRPTPQWSISNLELTSAKKIDGTNRTIVADKSSLLEVVGNVTYPAVSAAASRTPLPKISLSGSSGIGSWSVEPIAVALYGPLGCYSYLFLDSIGNSGPNPATATSRLDFENGKVRLMAGGDVASRISRWA